MKVKGHLRFALLPIAAFILPATNACASLTPSTIGALVTLQQPTHRHSIMERPTLYGWTLQVQSSKPTVHWREEFHLPAPAHWNTESSSSVSADQRSCVTEGDAPAGLIGNVWSVADGDPDGEYVMDVYVDGKFMRQFRFKLSHSLGKAHMSVVSGAGAFVGE